MKAKAAGAALSWWLCCPEQPIHEKVAGLIPSQGTHRRQPTDVSLSH